MKILFPILVILSISWVSHVVNVVFIITYAFDLLFDIALRSLLLGSILQCNWCHWTRTIWTKTSTTTTTTTSTASTPTSSSSSTSTSSIEPTASSWFYTSTSRRWFNKYWWFRCIAKLNKIVRCVGYAVQFRPQPPRLPTIPSHHQHNS